MLTPEQREKLLNLARAHVDFEELGPGDGPHATIGDPTKELVEYVESLVAARKITFEEWRQFILDRNAREGVPEPEVYVQLQGGNQTK